MKRILFVYHASNIGGGTYCLLNILKTIDRSKFEPVVLLRVEGDLVNEIRKLNIEVHFLPEIFLFPYNDSVWNRGSLSSFVRIWSSLKLFRKKVENLNVDAVYLNTMMLAPYLREVKELGLKTCIHLREHWPLEEHKCQLHYMQNIISKYADEIVAINGYSASIIPDREVTIVYDWIDMSKRYEFRPYDKIFGMKSDSLKVYLYTGGIQEIKGTCEIVKLFSSHLKGDDKRLLIVGASKPSKEGLSGKIKFQLSKIGIDSYEYKAWKLIDKDPRIVCIPAVYTLKHIMEQAYCNLSFFTIPHANLALAESIIVGTIPIAARTSESEEYSDGGQLALLYEIGNEIDLLEKLKYLDDNYCQLKDALACHRTKIENMFNPQRNAEVLNSVYAKLFKNY